MEERGKIDILGRKAWREKEMREGVKFFLEKKTGNKRARSH